MRKVYLEVKSRMILYLDEGETIEQVFQEMYPPEVDDSMNSYLEDYEVIDYIIEDSK